MYVRSDVEAVAQHLPSNGQAEEESEMSSHLVHNPFHLMSYGMEYPFGPVSCPHLVSSQLLLESFAENGLGSVQVCFSEIINIRVFSLL